MSVYDYINSDIFVPVFGNKLPLLSNQSVDDICKELFFAIKGNEQIFIYGDYDMDGFCAQKVWYEVLTSLYDVSPIHFEYNCRTHNIDHSIIDQLSKTKARVVIICDTGSGESDHVIVSLLKLKGYVPIIIDHHTWDGDYVKDTASSLVFNAFEERSIFNGHEVSGAYASLLVANRLCEIYFSHSLSYNAMVYALASMYSDNVDMSTPIGRALYNIVNTLKLAGPQLLQTMNKFDYHYSKRFFSFIISPKINACFRTESFGPINQALKVTNKFEINKVVKDIQDIHSYSADLTSLFIPLFKRERYGDVVVCTHDLTEKTCALHIQNFTGLIANAIAREEKAMAVVVVNNCGTYRGSFRDYFNRKLLTTFKLFCDAGGHDPAFGFNFTNFVEFKRHVQTLSKFLEAEERKDYIVISSSLISTSEDIEAIALYNEYMNVQPRVLFMHRCSYVRTLMSTKYKKIYDIGLPYQVSSVVPLYVGMNALIEPVVTRHVELRCLE